MSELPDIMPCFVTPQKGEAPDRTPGNEMNWQPDEREQGERCNGSAVLIKEQIGPGATGYRVKCSKCGNQTVMPVNEDDIAIIQWNHIVCQQTGDAMPQDQADRLAEWIAAGQQAAQRDKGAQA